MSAPYRCLHYQFIISDLRLFLNGWHADCIRGGKLFNMNKNIIPIWVGEENFDAEVMIRNQIVLVAFLASWSQPCKIMDAVLTKVSTVCAGRLKVVEVNADDHPALSLLYDIQSIPTLLYFVDGIIQERMVGTVSAEAILNKLLILGRSDLSKPHLTENKQTK